MGAHAGVRPRGIAQSGSAPALGAGCRGFESLYPDHLRLHGRVTAKGCGGDCPDLAESESAAGVTSVQSRFLDKQAPVAQRIEHQPSKLVVTGSIPVGRTSVTRVAGADGLARILTGTAFVGFDLLFSMVGVAQLVRVPDCDSGCRGFESHRSPHTPGTRDEVKGARVQTVSFLCRLPRALYLFVFRAVSSVGRAVDS